MARFSGRKKEPKPKLFGPDIFQWGRGLPRERVGAKKFDTSLETREIKLFGRDIPGFCRDIPGAPEKFDKKNVCVQFPFPRFALIDSQIRTNRLIHANRLRVPELNPLSCESRFGALKHCELQVEAIRANRLDVINIEGFSANRFARIDSRESPRFALQIAAGPSKAHEVCHTRWV